jgi:hypothetical protein
MKLQNSVILRAIVAFFGLEVRERASNVEISIWARMCRWCSGIYPASMFH